VENGQIRLYILKCPPILNLPHLISSDAGDKPADDAIITILGKILLPNQNSNHVTVITELEAQPIALNTSLNAIPDHTSSISNPTFDIQVNSEYTSNIPHVLQVYFQVDTWQRLWMSATQTVNIDLLDAEATTFWEAHIPAQQNGVHILYAFATDGMDAGSINPSPNYSPIVGRMRAYLFLVRKPWPALWFPIVFR
jgi:hypothetical protein